MPVILAGLFLLLIMYAVWRVRYGPLPAEIPRVLCFHKVSERFCWEGTWTTPARFFGYIDRLAGKGYRFIGEDEYLKIVSAGGRGRRKSVFLTFDDGYAEIYSSVLPGLEKRGVPSHVFLPTDYVGETNTWDLSLGRRPFRHLSWAEIESMAQRGVTFGSHGASHRDLGAMTPPEVEIELVRSKAVIEERLGRPVRTVSYPFGRFRDHVIAAARAAGYECAFSLYPGRSNARVDRFALRRSAVYIIDPVRLVETKLENGPLFWFEEMKCRAINGVAALTPLLKRLSPDRGSRGRTERDNKTGTAQRGEPAELGTSAREKPRER